MRLGASVLAGIVAAALGIAPGTARSSEPVKIRAGWIITPASLVPVLFAKEGVAKHRGISYDFEPIYFSASTAEVTAVATGDIDVATLGYSSFSIAVENAGLRDLRIVADEIQDGVDDYATTHYVVRNDSAVKSIEDLKGKTLATNGLGSGVDIAMRTMLRQHGLAYKTDYNIIEVPFPNMKAVLLDGKVDLATAVLPFVYDPELQKSARTLFTAKEGFGVGELSFWTLRADFIARHRAAVVDLLEDYVRWVRWYTDPANHAEAVAILAKFTKQPPERLDGWLFTRKDDYRDPNGLPDLDVLQKNIRSQKELGFIKSDLDVEKYADLGLVKEAVQRIK